MKRFRRAKAITLAFVALAVVVVASFVGTSAVLSTVRPDTRLIAANDFSITSTISSSNSTQTAALLYPGTQRYLWYEVHNPLSQPIKVLSLGVALDPAFTLPVGCDATNLSLPATLTGTVSVPVVTVPAHGTNTVVAAISLINKTGASGNQDACKNKTFHFKYSGSGQYTEVYATSTAVTSSGNPSIVGAAVTYTATVTGIVGSGQDPLPNSPTGTVTFKDGATTICSANIAVTSATATTSKATCTPPAYLVTGTHPITAVYSNSDGNFTGSNGSMSQVVGFPSTCPGAFNIIIGNPASPTVNGTNGNDYIYAVGANFTINGLNGNDCIVAGDGTNTVTDGNGDNVITAGNGKNTITSGNGNNKITVGNGSNSKITVGNGNNSVTVGTGSTNTITAGNGNNTFRITSPGDHDTITAGNGNNVSYLGSGLVNKFTGGKAGNICHLPTLPASTYGDVLVNCTAVTP